MLLTGRSHACAGSVRVRVRVRVRDRDRDRVRIGYRASHSQEQSLRRVGQG